MFKFNILHSTNILLSMKKFELHWQILISLFLAVLFGYFFSDYVDYVSWAGTIFLNALKMIIVPLIVSSIISGIASIGHGDNLRRIGIKTVVYYVSTSLMAILTGLLFVNIIKPGVGVNLNIASGIDDITIGNQSFVDTLINIVPTNIIQACAENSMLSVIFVSILFGVFINKSKPKTKVILSDFFNALFDLMMKITMFIIKFTPIGIFGIVATVVAQTPSIKEVAAGLGLYTLTVLGALLFHAFITLPLILKFVGKVSPLKQIRALSTPLLTAFSTSSSSATLPLTIDAVENKAGVSNKISSFTLPLGATINMDGTALYELVAAMFIAQAYGIELTFVEQFIAVGTALLASIGAAGIPMAGLVMLTVILSAIGLPLEGIGLILIVDRVLDMFRTTVNVWSDSCGASIIAKSEGEVLKV